MIAIFIAFSLESVPSLACTHLDRTVGIHFIGDCKIGLRVGNLGKTHLSSTAQGCITY